MSQSENNIIERCRKGERKAQLQFYSMYYKRVYNSCFRILRDSFEAENAMQESFLKVFSKLDQYEEMASVETWIIRVAINTSIDKLRKENPEFTEIQENQSYIDSYQQDMENWEGITEKVEQIKYMINQLPDKYRIIVTLHLIEGFDFDEIAEIMKQNSGTVRVQFMRGKEKLKILLQAS